VTQLFFFSIYHTLPLCIIDVQNITCFVHNWLLKNKSLIIYEKARINFSVYFVAKGAIQIVHDTIGVGIMGQFHQMSHEG
jgi:hypothetical protein